MGVKKKSLFVLFVFVMLGSFVFVTSITGDLGVVVLNPIPVITLVSPVDNTLTNTILISFNCNVNDDFMIENVTLYVWNSTGEYYVNSSNISGIFNSSSFDVDLVDGVYEWNCLAWDNESHSSFRASNNTFEIETVVPEINVTGPADGMSTTSKTIVFDYVVNDSKDVDNCSLVIDGTFVDTAVSPEKGVDNSFVRTLTVGSFLWKVVCYDEAGNRKDSIVRSLTISSSKKEEEPLSPGGSAGGGFVNEKSVSDFIIDKYVIDDVVYLGEKKSFIITIKNTGSSRAEFILSFDNLNSVLELSQEAFFLGPGEQRDVILSFVDFEGLKAGVYTGTLYVVGGHVLKEVKVLLEVKDEDAPFDLLVTIDEDKNVAMGSTVSAFIGIARNAFEGVSARLRVSYYITDFNQQRIFSLSDEVIDFRDDLFLERSLEVPLGLSLGKYLFVAEIRFDGRVIKSFEEFEVVEMSIPQKRFFSFFSVFVVLGIFILIWLIWFFLKDRVVIRFDKRS